MDMENEVEFVALSPEMLFNRDVLLDLYDQPPEERERRLALMMIKAKELGLQKQFKTVIKAYNKAEDQAVEEYQRQMAKNNSEIPLEIGSNGKPVVTVENYVKVMRADKKFAGLQYNELTYSPEQVRGGKPEKWKDVDDSETRRYIEAKYRFHSVQKCEDALRIVLNENRYHPIKRIIDAIEWDGQSRIYDFLHKWTKCEDTPYTREVSRLIFAGGIHRLYKPGCKFDDMPVLIGTKQGEGKSTLVRWLALQDEFFAEITMFEGREAIEQLSGAWICEVSELLAMTKTKEQEAVKSYLTRLTDKYREPYARRTEDRPRQCIFIGTTNKEQFLTDKTGNRRFYPVKVHQSGYDLFNHEVECRADIYQCWAEAKALFDEGKIAPFADRTLIEEIRQQQQAAVEDDYRVGMIQSYLDTKKPNEICALELWQNALKNGEYDKPNKKDSTEIGLIMQGLTGWEKVSSPKRFALYGLQRYWRKTPSQSEIEEDFEEIF